jgi:hypothetical protein
MANMNMVKIEIDIAFEDEEFGETLERLSKAVPSAYVQVWSYHGPGGGWPAVEILLPADQIPTFAKWYCEDDAAMWEQVLTESAKPV